MVSVWRDTIRAFSRSIPDIYLPVVSCCLSFSPQVRRVIFREHNVCLKCFRVRLLSDLFQFESLHQKLSLTRHIRYQLCWNGWVWLNWWACFAASCQKAHFQSLFLLNWARCDAPQRRWRADENSVAYPDGFPEKKNTFFHSRSTCLCANVCLCLCLCVCVCVCSILWYHG